MFGSQIVNNCFSHNSKIVLTGDCSGYCEEEVKLIWETPKILDSEIEVSATCVRIPVETSHSLSVKIVLKNSISEENIRFALEQFKGITVIDDRENNKFPEPILASGKTEVFVGRIRRDYHDTSDTVYHMFICWDQLLKGES